MSTLANSECPDEIPHNICGIISGSELLIKKKIDLQRKNYNIL